MSNIKNILTGSKEISDIFAATDDKYRTILALKTFTTSGTFCSEVFDDGVPVLKCFDTGKKTIPTQDFKILKNQYLVYDKDYGVGYFYINTPYFYGWVEIDTYYNDDIEEFTDLELDDDDFDI